MHFSLNGIVATAFVLGIMIFIHELAHFVVAKACGVKVETFSLGFGKRIAGFHYKETDYRISILPLGGYVKMAGELPGDETTGAPNEFDQHPRWQRVLIALAGPVSNFLLAIVLMIGVYMHHNEVSEFLSQPAVLDYVARNTMAANAGFATGDRIVQIGKSAAPTWDTFFDECMLSVNRRVEAVVERGGQRLDLSFVPDNTNPEDDGFVPIASDGPLKVDGVEEDFPAGKAGIKPGDEVVSVNGWPIHSLEAFKAYLQDHNQAAVLLQVKRGEQMLPVAIQPKVTTGANGKQLFVIGIHTVPPPAHIEKQGFVAATKHSLQTSAANSTLIFEVLKRMFTFRMSPKSVDGPIGIMRVTSQAVEMPGWTPLIVLMSMISLNLGIMNLLPFPILDGGVILLLLIESLMRHDLKPQWKERIYQGAFVVLVLLFVLIIFNDLSKLSLFTHAKT